MSAHDATLATLLLLVGCGALLVAVKWLLDRLWRDVGRID